MVSVSSGFTINEGVGGVGVLGGTFDPLHLGHLIIAEEALTRLALGEVIFVPAGDPYHRERQPAATAGHRLEMVRRGIASNIAFRAATVDIDRPGPSYSVDTVADIRKDVGEAVPLWFIIGWDSLLDLHRWRQPDVLLERCRVVVVRRPGAEDIDWSPLEQVAPGARERIVLLETPVIGISATEVRRRVAAGDSIRYWVPDAVVAYIADHGLYRDLPRET